MVRFAILGAMFIGLCAVLYKLALKLAAKRKVTLHRREADGKVTETITEEIEE